MAALAHAEAGRRPLPASGQGRLLVLAITAGAAPAGPPAPPPPDPLAGLPPPMPAAAPEALRRRHRDLRLLLLTLGRRLARRWVQAAALAQRHQGLAHLRALPAPPDDPAEAAHLAAWCQTVAADLAAADPDAVAAAATASHLQAARLAGLRAELAALTDDF